MTHSNVVSITEMSGKLHDVPWLREKLAATEPLDSAVFSTGKVKLRVDETDLEGKRWNDRDLTAIAPAWLEVEGGERYALTRQALMEVGSECHLPRKYQEEIPTDLLTANINWWLSGGLGERNFKLLTCGMGAAPLYSEGATELPLARAMTRATVSPFSNLALLDILVAGLAKKYGCTEADLLVDYKFHHDLEATAMRLIVPGQQRVISGTQIQDDTWSTGLQFKNSLIGLRQTEVNAYLFRWWCTNGAIDTNGTGGFARRGTTQEDVMAWAKASVDEVLGGLEHTLDEIQGMVGIPVTGEVTTVLADLFTRHSLPVKQQKSIIAAMADTDDMTMYGIMQAVTQAANAEDMDRRAVESLMRMGGHIITSAAAGRCSSDAPCKRLLPEGWTEPVHVHTHSAPAEPDPLLSGL